MNAGAVLGPAAPSRPVALRLTDAGLRLLTHDDDGCLRAQATATLNGGPTAHRTIVVQRTPPPRTR